MQGLFFEDYVVGSVYTTGQREISADDVSTFAELSGDRNPLHTDPEFALETDYGELIAHGLLGISVMTGLLDELGLGRGTALAFLGIKEWTFRRPIFFGDILRARVTIAALRRSRSDNHRGIVTRNCELFNQNDEMVQSGQTVALIRCRSRTGD